MMYVVVVLQGGGGGGAQRAKIRHSPSQDDDCLHYTIMDESTA